MIMDLKEIVSLSPEIKELINKIRNISYEINRHNWAEANAGNLSLNISQEMNALKETNAEWYLVTLTGSRYREMAQNPISSLTLIEVLANQEKYYPADSKPTSEWSSHRMLQQYFLKVGRKDRVIIHSHPSNIILLSQLPFFSDKNQINKILMEALTELSIYLPAGVGTVLYATPGSEELALNTLEAIGDSKALIWQYHGLLCTGENLDEAFDYMEIVEKAAELALRKLFLAKLKL
jgi:rhamnulose-1-phosphate aldolase